MYVSKYYAYQTSALLLEIFLSGLGLRVSYDWQATATKLPPNTQHILIPTLLWLLSTYSGCGTNIQAIPGLLSEYGIQATVTGLLATTITVCAWKFDYCFLYLPI